MPLIPGTRLGAYEIVAAIGAGSMGEVYCARDTRLQREVAIKILPLALAADPERRARFEREARMLAALNDPRIAAIYGVEQDPATQALALVLELVDGPTLMTRLAQGPLRVDEAIPIAAQIAGALEAAHERGVIHRDVKPANVKVTREGSVKVLDFGLAKALGPETGEGSDAAVSQTITNQETEFGTILGTVAYMAPEQARGRTVDRRADIWAFGVVFYEMLTGTRPFSGPTVSDTLADLLTRDPDWTRLPSDTPPALRELLKRCLDRNPQTRLQWIGEARILLTEPQHARPAAGLAAPRQPSVWPAIALALCGIAAGATLAWRLKPPAAERPVTRHLDLGVDALDLSAECAPLVSPDGRGVVYCSNDRLWVRVIERAEPQELVGTAGGRYPFWSPDGRQIAYALNGRLWRIALDRGTPIPIGPAPVDLGGSAQGVWTSGGNLVLAGSDLVGLFGVPSGGGDGKEILSLDKGRESDFHEISELPGARGLLFTVHRLPSGPDTIELFTNGTRRVVLQLPGEILRSPVYAAPGYLLYQRDTVSPGIWAIKFSLDRLATEGNAFLIVPAGTRPSAAADGTLAFIHPSDLPPVLEWRRVNGPVETIGALDAPLTQTALMSSFRLSPDAQRVALTTGRGNSDIWIYELDKHALTRLSVNAFTSFAPVWTVDGRRVLFSAFGKGRVWNIHAIGTRETREADPVTNFTEFTWPFDVSADGRSLLYGQGQPPEAAIRMMPLDQPTRGAPLSTPDIRGAEARFSPDGKWMAYTSRESGRAEIYIRQIPVNGDRTRVSTAGGTRPVWSRDGRLFFRTGNQIVTSTVTATASGVEASTPVRVLELPADTRFVDSFEVTPDGRRFLFARTVGRDRIGILLNWSAQLPPVQDPR